MSRSYRKNIRLTCGCGSNTKYYRMRKKLRRHRLNHEVRNLIANHMLDEVDNRIVGNVMPKEDQWAEPTDGHWCVSKAEYNKDKKRYDKHFGSKIKCSLKKERILLKVLTNKSIKK